MRPNTGTGTSYRNGFIPFLRLIRWIHSFLNGEASAMPSANFQEGLSFATTADAADADADGDQVFSKTDLYVATCSS